MSVNTIAHLVFLSQVLGGGAAEEGAWPESPTVCGHLPSVSGGEYYCKGLLMFLEVTLSQCVLSMGTESASIG